ncbi:flagellar hook-basal body complex protein [Ureibacillus manganicus]|uniref:Flagellar hook protein FlgE n=1 Tax=Ureibacillus manganicus DSM 26584 TaxID=1384049 RepID=A0A0A3IA72_9BACL|nr:flagellar hook-basal body complex protein [Ureibacillus manganicus]KGR80350.1 hypothetical protein CD29_00205 [Ureibacillus manganicus DSM 26584]
MLRSMYSGISGLKNFQTKLDVIGNNISNVNTYGFKKGRVVFKDLISQTTAGASAPTETRGGVNPKQVGLGSQIAAIDTIHGTGSLQTTSRTLDLAISGDGFFQVADSVAGNFGFNNIQYTRAGNFYMDRDGYVVNSDGKFLVGNAASVTSVPNMVVQITEPVATQDANNFPGYSYFVSNTGTNGRLTATGANEATRINGLRFDGTGKLYAGATNTPLNATIISGGVSSTYDYVFNATDGKIYLDNGTSQFEVISNNQYLDANGTTQTFVNGVNSIFTAINNSMIQDGTIDTFSDTNAQLRPIRIPTTAQSMSVGQDGTINFVDANGILQWAGQLQLAKFPNTSGLEKAGSNYYQQTPNSGLPVLGTATEEGLGSIQSGFLEMSNVDLSEEFTEMIVTQRGFQANSRIITTSDEILQELVNLKR